MAWEFKHPNYYKKLKREAASNEHLHVSNTNRFGDYKQASKDKQASNQQASRVSSTVDHGPGTTDPQA